MINFLILIIMTSMLVLASCPPFKYIPKASPHIITF